MIGWWRTETPVTVVSGGDPFSGDQAVVLATSYVLPGNKTLVAVASWAPTAFMATLRVDWATLRLDPAKVTTATFPAISNFQPGVGAWPLTRPFLVKPAGGCLLILG